MKLSKFIGRDQLPSDKVAFDRLAAAFADVAPGPINRQRRKRVAGPIANTTQLTTQDKK